MEDKSSHALISIKQKARLLMLLAALERVGIAPISMQKIHAFAFLADVLSPVWGLVPFDGSILKIEDGPHYADLQRELDELVIYGLVDVIGLNYKMIGDNGARIDGAYKLRFESDHLSKILSQIGALSNCDPLDPRDTERNEYLVELASALSMLPDDEIDRAAQADATYANKAYGFSNVIELDRFTETGTANESVRVTSKFEDFLPKNETFSPGQKVYLYASYLGRKISPLGSR